MLLNLAVVVTLFVPVATVSDGNLIVGALVNP